MTISFGGLFGKFLPHKIFGAKMVKVSIGLDNFGQVYWRRLKINVWDCLPTRHLSTKA